MFIYSYYHCCSDIYLEMIAEIDTDESGTVDFDGELCNNSSISIPVIFI